MDESAVASPDGVRRKYDGKRQVANGEWRMNGNDAAASVCRGATDG